MRLLLVRLSALGDIIHTWPLAVALREADDTLHLSWIVEEPLKTLVEGHPAVDAVFTTRTGKWRRSPFSSRTGAEISRMRSAIDEISPDIVLDAQGTVKSAWVCRTARGRETVGLCRPWRREILAGLVYDRCLPGSDAGHIVSTNLALVRVLGGETPIPDLIPDGRWFVNKARRNRSDFETPREPYGLIFPGAGQERKILNTEFSAGIARGMQDRGLTPIIAWGPGEEEAARAVCAVSPAVTAPPTDLEELAVLSAGAEVLIGPDTGPMHLGASLGRPVVAIHTVTDPRRNGPLGEKTRIINTTSAGPQVSPSTSRLPGTGLPTMDKILESLDEVLYDPGVSVTMAEEKIHQKGR